LLRRGSHAILIGQRQPARSHQVSIRKGTSLVKIDNSPARGTRDLLPASAAVRDHVLESITRVYRTFGYQRIEMLALEDITRLQGGQGARTRSSSSRYSAAAFPSWSRPGPARATSWTSACATT
jgi:hypothetical protein